MTHTIEIPLDESISLGLRHHDQRVGLIATAALQPPRPAPQTADPVAEEPVAELPPTSRADDSPPPASGERFIDVSDPASEAAASIGAASIESESPMGPDAAMGTVMSSAPTESAPRADRGGDVYIAHYYSRLPGDANQNPYTRLGGGAANG